jgi:hypothetical protein
MESERNAVVEPQTEARRYFGPLTMAIVTSAHC